MKQMTPAAVERAMKLQDVMLRAMAKRITWFQAAEILGISCRQMQRWHTRFEHEGYEGLFDRRRGTPSPKRVPLTTVEEVLRLYQEQYFDFNVRHFHEKLVAEHQDQAELHLGEESFAGSRAGKAQPEARSTSQAAAATTTYRGCYCILMAASTNGSAIIAGTTCWW